jgi:DNA uptake protein ComE-like DNA-binding protein
MFRNRILTTALLLLIALIALAACSPATQESATPTTAPTDPPTDAPAAATPTTETLSSDAPDLSGCEKLNLNTLSGDDLLTAIPDFTDRMVREFQEYRPYVSIREFRQEIAKYVDQEQVTIWEAYVFVPVDVNNADAETLMQIPGVDQGLADALIASRPYTDNEAFLITLGESVSTDDLERAICFLDYEA